MNIILSSLKHLPFLINGKVCVYNSDGSYSLYNPSKYTTISDGFDPLNYSLLVSRTYSKCIIYSSKLEVDDYLIKEAIKYNLPCIPYRIGDKIHIHSRRGIYELVEIREHSLFITCKKWQYTDTPIQCVPKKDFQALAGGLHNHNFS
jgi:hypothetical protein